MTKEADIEEVEEIADGIEDILENNPVSGIGAANAVSFENAIKDIEEKRRQVGVKVRKLKRKHTAEDAQVMDLDRRMGVLFVNVRRHADEISKKVMEVRTDQPSGSSFGSTPNTSGATPPTTGHLLYEEKSAQFYDLVDLIGDSIGLTDLGEQHDDVSVGEYWREQEDYRVSKMMREQVKWRDQLANLSRTFREYERLSKQHGENEEQRMDVKLTFEGVKRQVMQFRAIIEHEDRRRNLCTLDGAKNEKVKYPTFSGEAVEDFIKFKDKMNEAFRKNRVPLGDQLDILRQNLKGEALLRVPVNLEDANQGWNNLQKAYGDSLRVLLERIKQMKAMSPIPPSKQKEKRVSWLHQFETNLEDLIQLGGEEKGTDAYCTSFSSFTLQAIISALPEQGEDLAMRMDLSATPGQGRDKFLGMKDKIAKFREMAQNYICSEDSGGPNAARFREKKSPNGKSGPQGNSVSMPAFDSPQRDDKCRICQVIGSSSGVAAGDHPLFENHLGTMPTQCPNFITARDGKRRAVSREAKLCWQCLDPRVNFDRDHKQSCPVAQKPQFYTCKAYNCNMHVWLCTKHRDNEKNKKFMETSAQKIKSKLSIDLAMPLITSLAALPLPKMDDLRTLINKEARKKAKERVETNQELVKEYLIPVPSGSPIFLFWQVKGRTRPINILLDSGCSHAVVRRDVLEQNELPGSIVRKGPFHITGVGGIKVTAYDEWVTALEKRDGKFQALQVITVDQVTADFPTVKVHGAATEVKADKPSNKRLQSLTVPDEVGGRVDILLGIHYNSLFPSEVHKLPSGLAMYESVLASHDDKATGLVGGSHATFDLMGATLVANFMSGLRLWYELDPHTPMQYDMTDSEEGYAITQNMAELDSEPLRELVRFEEQLHCNHMKADGELEPDKSNPPTLLPADLEDIGDKGSVLRRMLEMQELGGGCDFRCVRCRDCADCRDADRTEKISIREESEMFEIKKSITLDYGEQKIECTLPMRGSERDFLSSNRERALKILESQCRKYSKDTETRNSICQAFQKLLDKGYIRKISDLSEEELEIFCDKEVQHYIPWRTVFKASASTPTRPVMDASTNTRRRQDGSGGSNLNNAVCKGKVDTLDLLRVVLRWFVGFSAGVADLTKMYNQFRLRPGQWNLQRILLKPNLDPREQAEEAVIVTLIYGVSSVSCQTETALTMLADHARPDYPEAAQTLDKSRYVDNIMESKKTREELENMMEDVEAVLAKLNLPTKGWSVSGENPAEAETLDGASVDVGGFRWFTKPDVFEVKVPRLHFGSSHRGKVNRDVKFLEDNATMAELDKFVPQNITRRIVVSKRAALYDLAGKLSPVMAKLKMLEREVVKATSGWDDPVTLDLREKVVQHFHLMERLRGIKFSRPRMPVDAVEMKMRIITVVDAAEVLIMTTYCGFKRKCGSWSNSHLIGRSALTNESSIPRREMSSLMGGSNLAWMVRKALGPELVIADILAGDSEIALHWTVGDHRRLDMWHRNRAIQIRRLTELTSLYKVKTDANPADIGTRPEKISIIDIGPDSRYECGDPWMRLEIEEAVEQGFIKPAVELTMPKDRETDYNKGLMHDPDIPEVIVRGHASSRVDQIQERVEFAGYIPDLLPTKRRWPVMVRITTLVITFLAKIKRRLGKGFNGPLLSSCRVKMNMIEAENSGLRAENMGLLGMMIVVYAVEHTGTDSQLRNITVLGSSDSNEEKKKSFLDTQTISVDGKDTVVDTFMQTALCYYFRLASREVNQFNSVVRVKKLCLEMDGILLSKGRLLDTMDFVETADLDLGNLGGLGIKTKIPVLDRYSPVSYSIAQHIHYGSTAKHRSEETSYRQSLEQVSIIRGLSLFKEIRDSCVKCQKKKAKFIETMMGPVSDNQLTLAPAFHCSQIDLFGPVKVFMPGHERATRNASAKQAKNWVLVTACTTTKCLNIQVVDRPDSGGILEALVRLGCEVGWPRMFFCDQDRTIMSVLRETKVNLRDLKYRLYTEHGARFEVCSVGGHYRHGLVERRIKTVQDSMKELGLDNMRLHSMGLQTLCKIVENTLNGFPLGYSYHQDDSNKALLKLISPNMLRHGRNNNRAVEGPVKLSQDHKKMLADIDKKTEAWFRLWVDTYVPRLLEQKKWFKSDKDLMVDDVVIFQKEESAMGPKDWTMGVVDEAIKSRDDLVRRVIIRYQNHNEEQTRYTERSVRKIVKLFNIEDEELQDDLAELQRRLDAGIEVTEPSDLETDALGTAATTIFECKSCCCLEHCKISQVFHVRNFSSKKNSVYVHAMPGYKCGMQRVHVVDRSLDHSDLEQEADGTADPLNECVVDFGQELGDTDPLTALVFGSEATC